jgi:hypothetical protein
MQHGTWEPRFKFLNHRTIDFFPRICPLECASEPWLVFEIKFAPILICYGCLISPQDRRGEKSHMRAVIWFESIEIIAVLITCLSTRACMRTMVRLLESSLHQISML